uniref:uncharacterized protein LOC120331924 n=1 Tax=Styela clava TaxID=7725 RepID=UPI001939D58B|nr:uncharacterized protein LOC120331924 [Styela clava]
MTTYCTNGKREPWIFFLLSMMISASISSVCEYHGDMCSLDPNACFKPSMVSYEMKKCDDYTLCYGPGEIYDSRGDIEFWIKIVHDREAYAENMSYRIMSYFQTPENNLSSINGCCSLSLNDTCTLPALKNRGETQFAIIPMRDGSYCQYHFYESPGSIEWCTIEDSDRTICKEFVNGTLILRSVYIALTLDLYSPIADYCFFQVPSTHYDANHTETYDNGLTRSIKNVTMLTEEKKVKVNYSVVDCDHNSVYSKQGVDVHQVFSRYKRSVDVIPCVISRTRNDERWDKSPTCAIPTTENIGQRTWVAIVTVVCLGIIVLLVLISLLWIYKNHVKTFFPDYNDTIKEIPDFHKVVLQENTEEGQSFILDDEYANNMSKTRTERPDEIFCIGDQKSAGVAPLKKDPENLEISYLLKEENVNNKRERKVEKISETENENPCKNKDDQESSLELENTICNNPEYTHKQKPENFKLISENALFVREAVSPGPDSGFSQTSFTGTANYLPRTDNKINNPDSLIFDYETDLPGVETNDGYMDKSANGAFAPKYPVDIELKPDQFLYARKARKLSSSSGCGSADEETFQDNTRVICNANIDVISTKDHKKFPNYIKQYSPSDGATVEGNGPFILTVSDGYTPKI